MDDRIIKSITEAYSMQPITKSITSPTNRSVHMPENDIKEIRMEEFNKLAKKYLIK